MPSSTPLLEAGEGESEVPPPLLHAFAGIGLEQHGTPSQTNEQAGERFPHHHHHHAATVSHFSILGTVLDLKPLSLHQQSSEEDENMATTNEEDPEVLAIDSNNGMGNISCSPSTLLAQAQHLVSSGPGSVMPPGMEPPPPDTILLYNNEELDNHVSNTGMGILPPGVYGEVGYDVESTLLMRRKSVNTTECVTVPSSEHVAEIVGRQGCKIKALRAKTNTYIKTPVRGEQPVFVVTGRKEDVAMAKREILSAAEHFSLIRASRNKAGPLSAAAAGNGLPGAPALPGQTTIPVRVPYRVVGLVVGPKGATIKRIQQQTHTYIVTPSRDKEPVFEVTGMPENVDRAREEIEAHIALRTGTCGGMEAPGTDDNDFHFNGTDVSFEASITQAGLGEGAWLRANQSSPGVNVPTLISGAQQINSNINNGVRMSSTYRNDSSSSLGSGSSSADSFYGSGNRNRMADFSPTCPFNVNANNNNNSSSGGGGGGGGCFWLREGLLPLGSEELAVLGCGGSSSEFDPLTVSTAPGLHALPQPQIWRHFLDHQGIPGFEARQSQSSQPGTPRHSPTFPGTEALEHPQAWRVKQVPFGSSRAPDSHQFPACGPAFSSSSDSASSASPSDASLAARLGLSSAAREPRPPPPGNSGDGHHGSLWA